MTMNRNRATDPEVGLHLGTGARMSVLSNGSAALVLTGPPYFDTATEVELLDGIDKHADLNALANSILLYAWSLRGVFAECERVLMPGGRLIVQTRDVRLRHVLVPLEGTHRQMIESLGFGLLTKHLWRPKYVSLARGRVGRSLKNGFGPTPFDPEVFLVFLKPGPQRYIEPTHDDVTLLEGDICVSDPGRVRARHRFQAPIPMLRALIRAHSLVGEAVVDPFMGGGTTLRVAIDLGRHAQGWEIDEDAMKIARINLEGTKN